MSSHTTRDGLVEAVRSVKQQHPDWGRRRIAAALNVPHSRIERIYRYVQNHPTAEGATKNAVELDVSENAAVASSRSSQIRSVDDLVRATKLDLDVWEIERHVINKWEVAMREPATTVGGAGKKAKVVTNDKGAGHTLWTRGSNVPLHEELWQVKVWLKRRSPQILAGEALLKRIEAKAPVLTIPEIRRKKFPHRRALEVCIMDPHVGLLCQKPEADAAWDLDIAAAAIMGSIDDLVAKAMAFGPFDEVFLPFGNDFVHSDTVFHTTTAGTGQPESIAWHHVYDRAESIAVEMITRLRRVAKEVYVYEIPGNHSRMADFTLARLLRAYFRNDPNVHVDASSSPYKFHRFGTTLIGYEHGHSVSSIRLASLMANERGRDFAEAHYREWHLGDQHRKGSSNPAAFEEQGVSVEYIPGLTAPNEWHRLKAFNHQKRGAMAWVYDHATGPIARFQHNISHGRA